MFRSGTVGLPIFRGNRPGTEPQGAAQRARIANPAPHDLRRTRASLCHLVGGELEHIQFYSVMFRFRRRSGMSVAPETA